MRTQEPYSLIYWRRPLLIKHIHGGTYFQVSWYSPTDGYGIYTHRYCTYSRASWCSSTAHYTITQRPALGYPFAALSQGIHTYRHGILVQFHCRYGILVQLHCRLYKNTGTYPWVSCSSSAAGYTYYPRYLYSGTLVQLCCRLSLLYRNLTLGILMQLRFRFRSYIMHRESVPWYLVVTLPQAILKHRNLLSCILVQLCCRLYMHTVTCFPESWCSFASSCTYTLEPSHGYPGAALFPTLCTHR